MTELSALAGSEGYAACDDDGGLYCQKRPSRAFFDSLNGTAFCCAVLFFASAAVKPAS